MSESSVKPRSDGSFQTAVVVGTALAITLEPAVGVAIGCAFLASTRQRWQDLTAKEKRDLLLSVLVVTVVCSGLKHWDQVIEAVVHLFA